MPVKISKEQLGAWVAEAEEGYDLGVLKKRGRPSRGADASQVITVRLTPDELEILDRIAAERHLSRSELMRQSIAVFTME